MAQARMPRAMRGAQRGLGAGGVERAHHFAVRADALVDLDRLPRRASTAARCAARRASGGAGRRCAASRRSRAWSRTPCGRPCARAARWWRPWCPCCTASMSSAGSAAPACERRAARGCRGSPRRRSAALSESSLCVTSAPSGRRATMSVNVPPRSIQNCQPATRHRVRAA